MTTAPLLGKERLLAFTDGVTAIALTLLILPLTERVAEFAGEGVATYIAESGSQLFTFVMSFAMIATFWMSHHRVFDRVTHANAMLSWLSVAWMFVIVTFPVTTALMGSMPTDAPQMVLYIGSLALVSAVMLVTRLYLRAHPELHEIDAGALVHGIRMECVVIALFLIALLIALFVPGVHYLALLILPLTAPIGRWMRARAAR